jgi:hypothetical protein
MSRKKDRPRFTVAQKKHWLGAQHRARYFMRWVQGFAGRRVNGGHKRKRAIKAARLRKERR